MFYGKLNYRRATGTLKFTDEDGMTYEAYGVNNLMKKVLEHRETEGGDLQLGWKDRVGNQLCEQNNYSFCFDGAKPVERKLEIADISSFFSTVFKWRKKGFETVSQEEATRRAEICITCSENVEIAGCAGCYRIMDKVQAAIGNKTTKYGSQLNGCNICACSLKAKIWLPKEVMQGSKHVFPDYCWLKEE